MRPACFLLSFLSAAAFAFPRGGVLDRCEVALVQAGDVKVEPAEKDADILRERLLANSEFPQADFGIDLHLVATYLKKPFSAAELLGEPTPKDLENAGKAMDQFHERCRVNYRTPARAGGKGAKPVPYERLATLIRAENRRALYALVSVAKVLGAKMPSVAAEPHEWAAAVDALFLKPESERLAQDFARLGQAISLSLGTPAVRAEQEKYLTFLRESERKSDEAARQAAFGPLRLALKASLRERLTATMPELVTDGRLAPLLEAFE